MTRTRTSQADLERSAMAALTEAAQLAGFEVQHPIGSDTGHEVTLRLDGSVTVVQMKAMAYADPARVQRLIHTTADRAGVTNLLVADQVPAASEQVLRDAGWSWLNRSGRLRLRAPAVNVEVPVPPSPRLRPTAPTATLTGRATLTVAFQILLDHDEARAPLRPRPDAARLRLSPATISRSLAAFRDMGLIDRSGAPVLPELFWELAGSWGTERRWLAAVPDPARHQEPDPGGARWTLGGTAAAAALGAPVVAPTARTELYVPGAVALTLAEREHGVADPLTAPATVAVAPVWQVCEARGGARAVAHGWPIAHPIAVALDLAQDASRGHEVLSGWDGQGHRVW